MKEKIELNESMVREMVAKYIIENNLMENVEEGLGGKIAGGAIGAFAGKTIMKKMCEILGIEENGILGRVLCSRLVTAGIGTEVGDVLGDKASIAFGAMKALKEERSDMERAIPCKLKLMEMLDEGLLDPKETAENLIRWITEEDARRFIEIYDLHVDEDENEEEL